MMKRARELAVAPAFVLALGIGSLVAVTGCEGGDDDALEQADGSLQGELAIYMADDLERGVQTKQYAIRSAPGVERRVEFDSDPGLQPGARLRVWGVPAAGSRMRVTSLKQLAPRTVTQTITSQLKAGMKWPAKRLALIILDIGGGTNLTVENALKEIVGPSTNTDPPLRNYYAEASYGTEELDGQVFGPFQYSIGDCNTSGMPTMLRAMVDEMGGGTFNHYLWYHGIRTSACSWSGLARWGGPDRPANDTWYNASASCVVLMQEPGHNFGMQHSSSMNCGTAPLRRRARRHLHPQRIRRPLRPDGRRLPPHERLAEGVQGLARRLQHASGRPAAARSRWCRSSCPATAPGPADPDAQGAPVRALGRRRPARRTDMLTHYYLELRTKRRRRRRPLIAATRAGAGLERHQGRSRCAGFHTWILDMDPATSDFDGIGRGEELHGPGGRRQLHRHRARREPRHGQRHDDRERRRPGLHGRNNRVRDAGACV